MPLKDYFLADLPDDAELSESMLQEACETLKRNRDQYLLNHSTSDLVETLSRLAESWLEEGSPFRQAALEHSLDRTGFPPRTVARGLDTLFKQWSPENFERWLNQELGDWRRLDQWIPEAADAAKGRVSRVYGPRMLVHFTSGNIPNPTILSIVTGLIAGSAQFVKCAHRSGFLPRLFAHSLYEADPKLGACLELADWPGGREDLEKPLLENADCVTVTGRDETLDAIRRRLSSHSRFIGYGDRVSFGYITQAALSGLAPTRLADQAAVDIITWDQLGCLSPHVLYIEQGETVPAERFASWLAERLEAWQTNEPRRSLAPQEAAHIRDTRQFYELRAAHLSGTVHWFSHESTAWTVIYEEDPRFQLSCLNRFVYVKPVRNLDEALQGAEMLRGKVSTVGLGAKEDEQTELADSLARWGVPRICPLGTMQSPPLAWRHDGRPALADLLTWCDWEKA